MRAGVPAVGAGVGAEGGAGGVGGRYVRGREWQVCGDISIYPYICISVYPSYYYILIYMQVRYVRGREWQVCGDISIYPYICISVNPLILLHIYIYAGMQ
jgi:hypothetical protein